MTEGRAATGCARCGGCCDPVYLSPSVAQMLTKWDSENLQGVPDPRTDEGWAYWRDHGWSEDLREYAQSRYDPEGKTRANADFMAEHWAPTGGTDPEAPEYLLYRCDAYDADAKLCTAHEDRPPICADYPWYGREPQPVSGLLPQCSYWLDIPAERRPAEARPLLPLAVVARPTG